DARGEVAAIFAYPELPELPPEPVLSPPASPPASPLSSPLSSPAGARSLASRSWTLEVAVRYSRGLHRHPLDSTAGPPLPDLCELLRQPRATIATTMPPPTLRYGEELLLGAPAGAALPIDPD
ncbi:MAG TPA: hypothetical protein VKA84_23890, partial [Gemmatimonadaceae bacterium]|nr:hypothetical protein [Gemmatimonadaceae bacterium]